MNESGTDAAGWEQRWHPLRREWVVYAAHRNQRPWSGAFPPPAKENPNYDPQCYLCPGNERAGGARNPEYDGAFCFDNDFPVVALDAPETVPTTTGLYRRRRASGIARVVCYDPRHDRTLADLPFERVRDVFKVWREQTRELAQERKVRHVLIFENKGEVVGVSNPHPHCQIYATNFAFKSVEDELAACRQYRENTGKNLFDTILETERMDRVRVVAENENAIAFVPFFARYAFEVMVVPKKRRATLDAMEDIELGDTAAVFHETIRRFDLLFGAPFPYVLAVRQAPFEETTHSDYQAHLLLQPPLRQPGLQKFLAGPEIGGGNFMADTLPEVSAVQLRSVDLSDFRGDD